VSKLEGEGSELDDRLHETSHGTDDLPVDSLFLRLARRGGLRSGCPSGNGYIAAEWDGNRRERHLALPKLQDQRFVYLLLRSSHA
jgi:hypothetical protein